MWLVEEMEDVICDGVINSKIWYIGWVLILVYFYFESFFLILFFILFNLFCGFFL